MTTKVRQVYTLLLFKIKWHYQKWRFRHETGALNTLPQHRKIHFLFHTRQYEEPAESVT